MSTDNVIDTLSIASVGKQSVAERIKTRIDVLESWLRDGLPVGMNQGLPTSLAQLRKWSLPDHGILPIASPNDFTLSHPKHGNAVLQAQEALTAVLERYSGAPRATKRRAPAARPSETPKADYEKLMSLYHMERHERLQAEKLAKAQAQRCAQKDAEIADLKRQLADLASGGSLRVVS
jgi:hypothetical protein